MLRDKGGDGNKDLDCVGLSKSGSYGKAMGCAHVLCVKIHSFPLDLFKMKATEPRSNYFLRMEFMYYLSVVYRSRSTKFKRCKMSCRFTLLLPQCDPSAAAPELPQLPEVESVHRRFLHTSPTLIVPCKTFS